MRTSCRGCGRCRSCLEKRVRLLEKMVVRARPKMPKNEKQTIMVGQHWRTPRNQVPDTTATQKAVQEMLSAGLAGILTGLVGGVTRRRRHKR